MSQTVPSPSPNGRPRDINEADYYASEAAKLAAMHAAGQNAVGKMPDGSAPISSLHPPPPPSTPPPPAAAPPPPPPAPPSTTALAGGGGVVGGGASGSPSPPMTGLQAASPTSLIPPEDPGIQERGMVGGRLGMGMRTPPSLQMLISGRSY